MRPCVARVRGDRLRWSPMQLLRKQRRGDLLLLWHVNTVQFNHRRLISVLEHSEIDSTKWL